MSFWADNRVEPKRGFRFLMEILPPQGLEKIASYVVKTAKKPTFQMDGTAEVKYLQHTFKYPGRITWQPVDITILDPASPDSAAIMMNILSAAGYNAPDSEANALESISKNKAVEQAMGTIYLRQIDAEGLDIEEWKLHNAFLTNVDFGSVGYDTDDLVEYTLTVDYDFATLSRTSTPVTSDVSH
tara:strand:+ start:2831 stop:3385 length:555 start_codon:yes stop_codon:yes gene_type:complete